MKECKEEEEERNEGAKRERKEGAEFCLLDGWRS
jgi:hypothetical protein